MGSMVDRQAEFKVVFPKFNAFYAQGFHEGVPVQSINFFQ
jgi:hypothetical protein